MFQGIFFQNEVRTTSERKRRKSLTVQGKRLTSAVLFARSFSVVTLTPRRESCPLMGLLALRRLTKNMSRLLSIILMCAALVGCSDKFTKEQRGSAKEVEGLIHLSGIVTLYSLDPRKSNNVGQDDFHGYKILGHKDVIDSNDRRELLSKLADSIRQNTRVVGACFNPRHGLRFKANNTQIDYVICFECSSAHAYGTANSSFLLTSTGKKEFNAFLDRHGIQRRVK